MLESDGARTGSNAWVIIPARGGSVGVPRKNLRKLGGKPLIRHTIDTALEVLPPERVIVVTDDAEIRTVAENAGARVIHETFPTPPEETLDTKVLRNLPALRERGARGSDPVLTVQPTSPLLRAETVRRAIRLFDDAETRSVLSVARDQHLRWKRNDDGSVAPLFTARVNRQQLPLEYRETGGVIAARLDDIEQRGTRVIEPVRVIELEAEEAIDIDNYADLLATAHLLTRMRVAIRVDASPELGMGHVYRMLALAAELARHEVTVYLSADAPLGQRFFGEYPYRTELVADERDFLARLERSRPEIVVFDVLDTSAAQIAGVREAVPDARIVSFEDRGGGAAEVDLLVTEFVDNPDVPQSRKLAGIDFALLAPSFEIEQRHGSRVRDEVGEVLVLFGGTDPSGLAVRALESLARVGYAGHVTVARGLGAEAITIDDSSLPFALRVLENVTNMPALMAEADFAFTSAGRTVIELLSQGTPAICLAQNEKELTHTHATAENGVLALGLGVAVDDIALDAATQSMLDDAELRRRYAERAARAGEQRSNRKTLSELLARLGIEELSVF
ncbi:MAG: cytidylyltransferase domain-containing protein [Leucobacter sp.]